MGSEQSQPTSGNPGNRARPVTALQRGKSVPERSVCPQEIDERPGSISPGPSICSDSDLPYISYTVNRPIGDSPKMTQKQSSQLQRGKSLGTTLASSNPSRRGMGGAVPKKQGKLPGHNIVVVKPAVSEETSDRDADLVNLQKVPMFLPIMRGTLNLPAVRDPEVLERLDPNGLLSVCVRYQQHMKLCSDTVAAEQAAITTRLKEVDMETTRLMSLMTDRQKKYAKYAEKLGKVHELSHQLNRCHTSLNQTLESMETLNNALPLEDRLEPFVWTTG